MGFVVVTDVLVDDVFGCQDFLLVSTVALRTVTSIKLISMNGLLLR